MSEATMDRELVKEWVAALRSGEYEQGRAFLRSQENAYCCLGVACDIALQGEEWEFQDGRWVTKEGYAGHLPVKLWDRLGVSWDRESTLIHMNDSGKSFPEIADWIETNILGGAE